MKNDMIVLKIGRELLRVKNDRNGIQKSINYLNDELRHRAGERKNTKNAELYEK